MRTSIHPPRLPRRALLAALTGALLAACSATDEIVPLPEEPAALQLVSRNPQPGVAGKKLPETVTVRVVGPAGRGMIGVNVNFAVTAGGGALAPATVQTDGLGYASAVWTLGPAGEQRAVATTSHTDGVPLQARIVPVHAQAEHAMGIVGDVIASSISRMVESLPQNPQAASFMEARLALVRTPGLGGDIIDNHRYTLGGIAARQGTIPVTAVFPVESMRAEAELPVRLLESALPRLESFLGAPYPTQVIRIWYGFAIGSSGGGGVLNVEDRTTYQARTLGVLLPYDPMIIHELSHTWFGSESVTQFMEVYGWNVVSTGSEDARAWTYTRNWTPGRESNEGVHALLDVYELIGPDAMGDALRQVSALRPPYGQPLTPAMQQAFVDAAPAAAKAAVAAKVAKVRV
jgi:hypothetical protein